MAVFPTKQKMRSGIETAARQLRDVILPAHCLACDVVVDQQGVVCPSCWAEIRFIDKPFCEVLGSPFSYDLGEGSLSAQAIAHPPQFDRARAVVLYDEIARRMVQSLKFSDRTELVPWMAQWMVRAGREFWAPGAFIIPVPLHRIRLFERRFNQSAELARHIASLTNLSYLPFGLERVRSTRQQVGLGRKERIKNVQGAFKCFSENAALVKGQHVIVIDDVFTTGATLEACARALKRAGAAQVDCLTFALVPHGLAVNEV